MLPANPAVERAEVAAEATEDGAAREALFGLLAAYWKLEQQFSHLRTEREAVEELPVNPGVEVAQLLAEQRTEEDRDRLLRVKEAAEILGVEVRWLYDRSDSLPFARKLAPRTLRFSERGLYRWMETRAP